MCMVNCILRAKDICICPERYYRWVSRFISDNLWQYSLNSIKNFDKLEFRADKLNDSFSTETKQTYDSPTRIFFYIFKSLIDWSWEKTSDISISVKLHEFQQWKHYIRKRYLSNAPDIFSRRIWHFFRFIHIFKHISQKRLWYGFLLALKKALNHREFVKKRMFARQ